MAEETTDWELLSGGSGSDVYWPDSEVDDTASLLESLSFTDSEEEGSEEEKLKIDLGDLDDNQEEYTDDNDDDDEATSVCDDTTLVGCNQEHQDVFSIAVEDFTPSGEIPSHTPPVEINSFPRPTVSSPESVTSGKACAVSEIMDRMTTLIENAISSIIEILDSPQILSEKDFVMRLLDDFEWDCTNLKEKAYPRTQLVERLDALLSKIVECVTSIGNRGALAAPSSSSSLSQLEIPECRQHPEPPTTPTARRTDEGIKKFRNQFRTLNHYTQCQCPSITCRLHPTVFPESRITRCRVEGCHVQRMNCGCVVCRKNERGYHHSIDHGDESKDGSWGNVTRFLHENGYSSGRKESWRNVKAFLDENYISPEYEEPKRDDGVALARGRVLYC